MRIPGASASLASFSSLGNPHVGNGYAPVSSVVGPRQERRSIPGSCTRTSDSEHSS